MTDEYETKGHTVFIEGETIDLCVPSQLAIEQGGWADWFNNQERTRFTQHGVYPNRPEDQLALYREQQPNRLAVLIKPKQSPRTIGIISLGSIDLASRSAEIAMMIGEPPKNGNLVGLEAMAFVTKHGFEQIGLQRVWAGQPFPSLKDWNKRLELLGYRSEGILRKAFVKGRFVNDIVMISCLVEDYLRITELRGGRYWPGNSAMLELVKALPETGFVELLAQRLKAESDQYYAGLQYV